MNAAVSFARDVFRAFTWRQLLLTQLLAVVVDAVAVVSFVLPFQAPASMTWSRAVAAESMAFGIVLSVLVADQAIARGAPKVRAYALSIVVASLLASVAQFQVRHWLGIYTNGDQPGREASQRRMQMVYFGSDTLTYGVLFILIYVDYRQRERLLRRVRAAELERALKEQRLVESQLAELRADLDAGELLETLIDLRGLFEQDSPDGERRLDELIASLRTKLVRA